MKEFTSEDLLHLPGGRYRYELVQGELKVMEPAGFFHGRFAAELLASLKQHVDAHELGVVLAAETGFKLASRPDTVLAPDVAFISQERFDESGDVEGYWPGAPDLAVEVLSPKESHASSANKAFAWLKAGTRMVVVVDPARQSARIYRSRDEITELGENDAIDGGNVVPGWRLPLAALFS